MPRQPKIISVKRTSDKNKEDIKVLKRALKNKSTRPQIQNGKKYINLKRAVIKPDCESKTVLTDSTWTYVEILLNQMKAEEAVTYWRQAKNFYIASEQLDLISKPLTTYYCLLNSTKALLKFKGVNFNLKHGVSGKRIDKQAKLQNEFIQIKPQGVLSGLCSYFGQQVNQNEPVHTIKDLFYNLPFIHRSFQLTYNSPAAYSELFVPIINPRFVHDKHRKKGWFEFELEKEHSHKRTLTRLQGFSIDRLYDNSEIYTLRRNKVFDWDCKRNIPQGNSFAKFGRYYRNIRKRLNYIYSHEDLWYIKRFDLQNHLIDKHPAILIFAAMHRLSELSRYQPQVLKRHLESSHSWLLTEFINKSMFQFIDVISSEITGHDFRMTGFRK